MVFGKSGKYNGAGPRDIREHTGSRFSGALLERGAPQQRLPEAAVRVRFGNAGRHSRGYPSGHAGCLSCGYPIIPIRIALEQRKWSEDFFGKAAGQTKVCAIANSTPRRNRGPSTCRVRVSLFLASRCSAAAL